MTNAATLRRISDLSGELADLLQEFPQFSGFANNDAGQASLRDLINDLSDLCYGAGVEAEELE